jgi:hypothetical protein
MQSDSYIKIKTTSSFVEDDDDNDDVEHHCTVTDPCDSNTEN